MKYHIRLDGETRGPFTRAQLEAKKLPPDTPCAAENENTWDKLGAILKRPEPRPLYIENTALLTLVCGALMALWLGAAVFGSGMARVLLGLGCAGVLMLGVLAIVRIRNAPEFGGTPLAVIGMVLAVASVVSAFLVTPPKLASSSNSGDSSIRRERVRRQPISNVRPIQDWIDIFDDFQHRVDMLERRMDKTLRDFSAEGAEFYRANAELRDLIGRQALTPPTFMTRARTRANRIKCVSNIKQVGSAFKSFANDNDDRMPWLLEDRDKAASGNGNAAWVNETSTLFSHAEIRSSLGSAKILVSPLDMDRQGVNDTIDLVEINFNNLLPNGGHSYGVVNGAGGIGKAADEYRPGTVLTVTRNISGPVNGQDSLSDQGDNPASSSATTFAIWKGVDQHPEDPRIMKGLKADAGQLGLCDGSASQSNDADVQAKIKRHHNELSGQFKGSPSGFLDTPND